MRAVLGVVATLALSAGAASAQEAVYPRHMLTATITATTATIIAIATRKLCLAVSRRRGPLKN